MSSADAEQPAVGSSVNAAFGEIVEGVLGDADDVAGDERRALGGALPAVAATRLPLTAALRARA